MNDQHGGLFRYENGLLVLLGFSFGVAFFDRQAATTLSSFIAQDLHLNNTQIGLLGSGLSLTWALGAYLIARWSDARGSRKPFLLAFLVIFSLCSVLSGLAQSFEMLLAARLLMGLVEGPFLPVCLALMMAESSEHRRGLNAGIMQNLFAALLGQSAAPAVLIPLAGYFDWRMAFYLAGIPGLVCAVAIYFWVREPAKPVPQAARTADKGGETMGLLAMLSVRNIALCCLISIFMVAWLIMGWTFFPTYFVDFRGMAPETMGGIMATLGICSALSGFGAPWLSDRIGRKPVMIVFCLAGVLSPLAAIYLSGTIGLMTAAMFVGWLGSGAFPLFMGVIPSESVARRQAASAMGIVVCVGEIVGGFGITTLAGRLADLSDKTAPLLLMTACAVIGGMLCLFLRETAPVRVQMPQPADQAAG